MKDFGTSRSTKIDSIFDSLLCPNRPDIYQDSCPTIYAASSLIPASSTS
ncbi:MAG: hypothetical protein KZQ66_11255 [Candidatus Thiodiazotropha sp. (ex Lucinoma aequizonata)]|nr:hypothetical protein [Candidatus Thiodiazotropha sp. (ex Lucinoma aequizonata)]MCU7899142.1 hypothetical protein [Candidatus Thiodiazotropha sp. (ex Lucinoma aequizonata)]MCU7902499.1 hypothetical protein [Candidatus Thiodiazotropha sp. (ex Lucinoma aequizonata)]MCU7907712.1 hypothetical protein [Candidatus Thiodiazotropha sp. (ex Lucinoma aequizonata)]MCU7912291.1 hypothetical protein [Candidatus Thiodiazotropha sp. (ex Lucinoma aequizonata)]